MDEFVDEFLRQFDDEVYKALVGLEKNSRPLVEHYARTSGYSPHQIGYEIDFKIRGKLGTEATQALVQLAIFRLQKLQIVKMVAPNIWRTSHVLDALAMLPRPHHADP